MQCNRLGSISLFWPSIFIRSYCFLLYLLGYSGVVTMVGKDSALARHTGQDEGEKTGHLVKRASILLQKGLGAMVLNRIPGHPNPVIDGQE